jgi:tripartite-type tricarboxylate transporter receptor subunit TctC
MAESGYPNLEADSWVGVLAPAGTPKEIVALLNREIVKIAVAPDTQERLVALGYEAVGSTPEDFSAQIRSETEKWARVVREANIKPM